MRTRPLAARLAAAVAAAGLAGLVGLAAPAGAQAASGFFIWTGPGGDTPLPFPADDQCFATPGATAAKNFTTADAFLFTDAECTTGKDIDSASAFEQVGVAFESVRLRTPAS